MCTGRNPSNNEIRKWLEEVGYNKPSGDKMDKQVFIKNIPFSEPQQLAELVEYEEGRVVSRTFAQNPSLSLTLFAFDKGEGVSTHTAPGDAMVQVLDGEAMVNIDGKKMSVGIGQVVVMPANVPHAVTAVKRFKMILTVVKKPVTIQS
jgi:quercetin dioxygenase-like cupin family protein